MGDRPALPPAAGSRCVLTVSELRWAREPAFKKAFDEKC